MKTAHGVVDFLNKLSSEITSEFPSTKGFSVRNLKNMARFYREYPEIEIVQSVTAQLHGHIILKFCV